MTDWAVLHGDACWWMRELPAESIDAVVCDPPYGLEFMGKEWDSFSAVEANASGPQTATWHDNGGANPYARRATPRYAGKVLGSKLPEMRAFQAWCEGWAREALRVLKPGGYLLAFGGTRTYHRLACGVEDAGFEVRDMVEWLYGSGFPKSRDLGDGWGTALKPGHEPICVARKPFPGTVAGNVLVHGVGGLNVDGCRIPVGDEAYARNHSGDRGHEGTRSIEERGATDLRMGGGSADDGGRWPANVVLDPEASAELDAQSGVLVSGANPTRRGSDKFRDVYGEFAGQEECEARRGVDVGGASRFYYCAKASREERNAGLPPGEVNDHPTVKPIELMRWLCRLVTPAGGVVLDPFAGSGTTGCAAVLEGFEFVGVDRGARYVQLAEWRVAHWRPQGHQLGLLA